MELMRNLEAGQLSYAVDSVDRRCRRRSIRKKERKKERKDREIEKARQISKPKKKKYGNNVRGKNGRKPLMLAHPAQIKFVLFN